MKNQTTLNSNTLKEKESELMVAVELPSVLHGKKRPRTDETNSSSVKDQKQKISTYSGNQQQFFAPPQSPIPSVHVMPPPLPRIPRQFMPRVLPSVPEQVIPFSTQPLPSVPEQLIPFPTQPLPSVSEQLIPFPTQPLPLVPQQLVPQQLMPLPTPPLQLAPTVPLFPLNLILPPHEHVEPHLESMGISPIPQKFPYEVEGYLPHNGTKHSLARGSFLYYPLNAPMRFSDPRSNLVEYQLAYQVIRKTTK